MLDYQRAVYYQTGPVHLRSTVTKVGLRRGGVWLVKCRWAFNEDHVSQDFSHDFPWVAHFESHLAATSGGTGRVRFTASVRFFGWIKRPNFAPGYFEISWSKSSFRNEDRADWWDQRRSGSECPVILLQNHAKPKFLSFTVFECQWKVMELTIFTTVGGTATRHAEPFPLWLPEGSYLIFGVVLTGERISLFANPPALCQ